MVKRVGGRGLRVSPGMVTFPFAFAILIVAYLALSTGTSTTGPWFSTGISFQVYSFTLTVASLLGVFLAIVASGRRGRIEELLLDLDFHLAGLAGSHRGDTEPRNLPENKPTDVRDGGEVSLPSESTAQPGGMVLQVERNGQQGVVSPDSVPETVAISRESLRQLLLRRHNIKAARDRIWPLMTGPILVLLSFAALSGMMLPGSEGFAEAHYQLNTTLILFLGYSWWILLAWTVAALVGIGPRNVP
jgi:hypothetical protein